MHAQEVDQLRLSIAGLADAAEAAVGLGAELRHGALLGEGRKLEESGALSRRSLNKEKHTVEDLVGIRSCNWDLLCGAAVDLVPT